MADRGTPPFEKCESTLQLVGKLGLGSCDSTRSRCWALPLPRCGSALATDLLANLHGGPGWGEFALRVRRRAHRDMALQRIQQCVIFMGLVLPMLC